ncbi:isochorismate synthase [Macrococcus brunensis]|uniref:isochorismate synthase n=1 Tax=Macrococcus brunensis TaxID=198483 RepID=UPI001EEFD86E|nr:isochorismate synthase [Macrococcus brunensis]ULG73727.1 isochorismate synthase [Macrococcus brunensis]
MSKGNIQITEQTGAYESPAELFKAAARYKGERYFYMNKDKSEWLIGLGHAYMIKEKSRSPERITEQFQILLEQTKEPHHIRLFGGFQFDAGNSPLFDEFGHSHFIWPKIQIFCQNNQLTYSYTDMTEEEILNWRSVSEVKAPVIQSVSNQNEEQFLRNVATAVEAMKADQFDKVVLSRQKKVVMNESVDSAWLIERGLKNDEYSYFLLMEGQNSIFVSRTPEQLVKVKADQLSTNAIAGTMARGFNHAAQKLLRDAKNLVEHDIVVKSITADIEPFTTCMNVPDSPKIMTNQFVYHLYTPITAKIEKGNVLNISQALHPTPALGGFPKQAAAAFIEQAEGDRGFYGAPMGYVTAEFEGEFIVAIRSMLIKENTAVLFAGCGVVADSIPESELDETETKFKPMLQLLGVTE